MNQPRVTDKTVFSKKTPVLKKTLMQFKTAEGRPILTVEPDGSVTYHEPLKPEEFKAAVEEAKRTKPRGAMAILSVTLFASELARLSHENAVLKLKLRGAPKWCPGCGGVLGGTPHVCPGGVPK